MRQPPLGEGRSACQAPGRSRAPLAVTRAPPGLPRRIHPPTHTRAHARARTCRHTQQRRAGWQQGNAQQQHRRATHINLEKLPGSFLHLDVQRLAAAERRHLLVAPVIAVGCIALAHAGQARTGDALRGQGREAAPVAPWSRAEAVPHAVRLLAGAHNRYYTRHMCTPSPRRLPMRRKGGGRLGRAPASPRGPYGLLRPACHTLGWVRGCAWQHMPHACMQQQLHTGAAQIARMQMNVHTRAHADTAL